MKTRLLFLLILSLLLTSCAASAEDTLRYEAETTLLANGSPIYVEDSHLEDYISKKYFKWRNEGNPNPDQWEDAVTYENGTDITLVPTAEVYSLSDGTEEWGLSVTDVSDDWQVGAWSHLLNLEKYEDGKWVRQGILNTARVSSLNHTDDRIGAAKKGDTADQFHVDLYVPTSSETWREGLTLLSPLTVRVDEICPVPTPGQYRFIFYISCQNGEEIEYRQYYIPFEVVE